jgi:hypothetical protein
MKALLTALVLSSLAAPVLALASTDGPVVVAPSDEEIGRRSGACPNRPEQPLLPAGAEARERSTNSCGGV